jgi:serine phosphatase RsbU (regulator of sigma subunit)/anti-sigma regulatory factor (Ser/Thr protein kinase)
MSDIVLLLSNRESRTQVAQSLIPQHEVSFKWPNSGAGPLDAPAELDLVVADASALADVAERIACERRRCRPVLLPVLLVSDQTTLAAMDSVLWAIVDDVALQSLDRNELQARAESLLRCRERSKTLEIVPRGQVHERKVTQRFQQAALPRLLPRVPGLTFGAYYRPGMDEAQVGGDWYDALQLPDGRVVFSIGDVCGSGLDAAVAMSTVRHTFRGAAQINPDPAIMLDAADRTLRAESQESIVTAFVGVFDPITSLVTYASAGHPHPFMWVADGSIAELASIGGPLGLPFNIERTVNLASMPLGSLLVLYTDGLTEATRDPIAGEAGVRRAIASDVVRKSSNVALAIHDAVIENVSPDDVAILTIAHVERDRASERLSHWSFDAGDAAAARGVRAELVTELQRVPLTDAGVANAELVFAELLGNVVRYAAKWVDVALDASGAFPVLHILDGGPGFRYSPRLPFDVLSERGRGLYIVAQLTEEFHVTKRPHGGSHARAVLSRTC